MPKLYQIIAARTGLANKFQTLMAGLFKPLKSPALSEGITKVFKPAVSDAAGKVNNSFAPPAEHKPVQILVRTLLPEVTGEYGKYIDLDMQIEIANARAKGHVIIDGETILQDVPVTALMLLEKRLKALQAHLEALPTQDPAVRWVWDSSHKAYAGPMETTLSKRTVKSFVTVAPATEHHPEQVRDVEKEEVMGIWEKTLYTGLLDPKERNEILHRLKVLIEAVAEARIRANDIEVIPSKLGTELMAHLLKNIPATLP